MMIEVELNRTVIWRNATRLFKKITKLPFMPNAGDVVDGMVVECRRCWSASYRVVVDVETMTIDDEMPDARLVEAAYAGWEVQ